MRWTVDFGSSARSAMLPSRVPSPFCVRAERVEDAERLLGARPPQAAVVPPSTTSELPVEKPAWSEAR